jgi:hypothetical protein
MAIPLDCSVLRQMVSSMPLVQSCDAIHSGALRMLTPFQYPNGSHIDLFLESTEPLLETRRLSDLGQTTGYLLDLQVRPWATNKRRQIIEDVCASLGVEWKGGRLQIELAESDADLAPFILKLSQACIRVSDLSFSARLWSAGSFRDEFEEFLVDTELEFQPDVKEPGKSGDDVKVDFRVIGETKTSLVLTLGAASTVSAHGAANEVLARWFDLKARRDSQFVTVVDETHDVFKISDLNRVGRLSQVFAFPTDQDQIRSALAA